MARKVGLGLADVVDAAAAVADRDGLDAVTLATVATALGVKAPSLYAHVAGLDGLRRELGREGARRLGAAMADAVAAADADAEAPETPARAASATAGTTSGHPPGRASPEAALRAVAVAYRRFAHDHPGLYAAMLPAPDPAAEPEAAADFATAIAAPVEVMNRFGLAPEATIDAVRTVRALLHGFVDLELRGGFGLPDPVDDTFAHAVDLAVTALGSRGGTRRRRTR
ncbi:TetR-like C-terminal domain-containing protein [Rhabdothermincola salaria]|uniref:TetR-like C-terminal domain-containing protein n=1 Tax=Rhabdothermincola salaria TaxID=2903142 RepID=UPI001E4F6A93|nr:WHG domain-containing protein [Rhabdothermincola salaria]